MGRHKQFLAAALALGVLASFSSCQNGGKIFFCDFSKTVANDDDKCFAQFRSHFYQGKSFKDKVGMLNFLIFNNRTKIPEIILKDLGNKNLVDVNGDTPLHAAAFTGNKKWLQRFVSEDYMHMYINSKGYGPLHVAVLDGTVETLQYLVQKPIALERKSRDGFTPLNLAAFIGNEEKSKVLVRAGADAFSTNKKGFTPLTFFAAHGFLHRMGDYSREQLNSKTAESWSPLVYSILMSREKDVEFILKKGVDIDLKNKMGDGIAFAAVSSCNVSMVKKVLSWGVNFLEKNAKGQNIFHELSNQKSLVEESKDESLLNAKHNENCSIANIKLVIEFLSPKITGECDKDNLGKKPKDYWQYTESLPPELACS